MSATLFIMRARSAKLVLRNVSKVFAARLNFASICEAVSGSNVFKTSPVAGLMDAIAIFYSASGRCDAVRSYFASL
jgi:hypothetical protein